MSLRFIYVLLLGICLPSVVSAQVDSINSLHKDTTRIILGKKEIQIFGQGSGTGIKIKRYEAEPVIQDSDDFHSDDEIVDQNFCGHWAGVEFGLNNYLNAQGSFNLDGNSSFMELRPIRSMNFSLNLFQHSFGFIGDQFGLVTGLGFDFANYYFSHNNSITSGVLNNQSSIVSCTYSQSLSISKLATSGLSLPLLLEFHFLDGWRISGGLIGEYKFDSHTKVEYSENNMEYENLVFSNFYMHSFYYCYSFRLGYKHFQLFFNYDPISMFQRNCGPELFPVTAGLSLCVFGETGFHSELHLK